MNFNTKGWDIKKPNIDPKQQKKIINLVIFAIIVIFIIILASDSYYVVSEKQQAIIITFGKYSGTPVGAGLHFKIPFIQEAIRVNVNVSHKQTIGYDPNTDLPISGENKMITGDFNIVNIDFDMYYMISDPYAYLFHSQKPDEILKNIAQSKIRNVISTYKVDAILTTAKTEIENEIKTLIIEELEKTYDIGLELTNIIIQDAEPPTDNVKAAFRSVETAKQGRETAKNEAEAYKNAKIPEANAEVNRLLENAEFVKANRINEANMQVAMFNAMYEQYRLNPNIHRQRMYYEMIEQVLPGVKVYIDAGSGDIIKHLPLDDFIRNGQSE